MPPPESKIHGRSAKGTPSLAIRLIATSKGLNLPIKEYLCTHVKHCALVALTIKEDVCPEGVIPSHLRATQPLRGVQHLHEQEGKQTPVTLKFLQRTLVLPTAIFMAVLALY